MGYQSIRPGYELSVDGIPLGRTHFVIRAAVSYQPQLAGPERQHVKNRAQMETLFAVFGECERATRIGARSVRVKIVGDGQLDRFFKRWPHILSPRPEAVGTVETISRGLHAV